MEQSQPNPAPKNSLKLVLVTVVLVVIILGGLVLYRAISAGRVQPSPTPSPTLPVWKVKSEQNVATFIDQWNRSVLATNPDVYATNAKNLLTLAAQTKLPTLTDSRGKVIPRLTDQLSAFVGATAAEASQFNNFSSTQIDSQTVEVVALVDSLSIKAKVFTTKETTGAWLIDSVRSWGGN